MKQLIFAILLISRAFADLSAGAASNAASNVVFTNDTPAPSDEAVADNTYSLTHINPVASEHLDAISDEQLHCQEIDALAWPGRKSRLVDLDLSTGTLYCDAVDITRSKEINDSKTNRPYEVYEHINTINKNFTTASFAEDRKKIFLENSAAVYDFYWGDLASNLALVPLKKDVVANTFTQDLSQSLKTLFSDYISAAYKNDFFMPHTSLKELVKEEINSSNSTARKVLTADLDDYFSKLSDVISTTGHNTDAYFKYYLHSSDGPLFGTKAANSGEEGDQAAPLKAQIKDGLRKIAKRASSEVIEPAENNTLGLSRALVGMISFDPDYVNFRANLDRGFIDIAGDKADQAGLKISSASGEAGDSANNERGISQASKNKLAKSLNASDEVLADKFDVDNFDYFISFFQTFEQTYATVIRILIAAIACYFFFTAAASYFLTKHLEKQPSELRWKSKLAAIVAACVVFFLPTNFSNGLSSTFFLSTFRPVVQKGNAVADYTAKLGYFSLLNKSSSAFARPNTEPMFSTLEDFLYYAALSIKYDQISHTYCENAHDQRPNFYSINDFKLTDADAIFHIEQLAFSDNKAESDNLVSFRFCRAMQIKRDDYKQAANLALSKHINESISIISQLEELESIVAADEASNPAGNSKAAMLLELYKNGNNIIRQLGWMGAALIPAQSIALESIMLPDPKIVAINRQELQNTKQSQVAANDPYASAMQTSSTSSFDFISSLIANTPYMLLPGASALVESFKNLDDDLLMQLSSSLGQNASALSNSSKDSFKHPSLFAAASLLENILNKAPLILGSVIAMIAIAIYLYELVVFAFVSPIVLTFAFTTGQNGKINAFLIKGIILILKPVFIVLGIYLGMFLYYFFQDLASIITMGFYESTKALALKNNYMLIASAMQLAITLLRIIALFGCMYLIYRVVSGFSKAALNILGVDIKAASNFAFLAKKTNK